MITQAFPRTGSAGSVLRKNTSRSRQLRRACLGLFVAALAAGYRADLVVVNDDIHVDET